MGQGLVLIVEDDHGLVAMLHHALTTNGYRVITAAGRLSLPLAHHFQPDVVLLDLHLPEMDGAQISRALKAAPATAHIPIVVMAAPSDLAEGDRHALRCEEYLAKPFSMPRLLATVARWMPQPDRRGAPRAGRLMPPSL